MGFESNQIINYFGNKFSDIELVYSIENSPLGTGGAIKKSLALSSSANTFILNGDTFLDADLNMMEKQHFSSESEITITVKEMKNFSRYGALIMENERITNFEEKKFIEKGFINAGIYLLNRQKFLEIPWPEKFSFEKEFLEKYCGKLFFSPFFTDKYFIDIGVPEDYYKVQHDFNLLF